LFPQIRQIRIKLALPRCTQSRAFCSFGKARRGDIPLHGVPADPKRARNGTLPQTHLVESHHLLIARDALVPAHLLFAFGIRQAREVYLCAGWSLLLFYGERAGSESEIDRGICLLFGVRLFAFEHLILDQRQTGAFVIQEALEMLAQILDEVIAIGDLCCMWQNQAHRRGFGACPVSAAYLDFLMTG
jgi:hypothetical protein